MYKFPVLSAVENWMLVNVSSEPEYKVRLGHCNKVKWHRASWPYIMC